MACTTCRRAFELTSLRRTGFNGRGSARRKPEVAHALQAFRAGGGVGPEVLAHFTERGPIVVGDAAARPRRAPGSRSRPAPATLHTGGGDATVGGVTCWHVAAPSPEQPTPVGSVRRGVDGAPCWARPCRESSSVGTSADCVRTGKRGHICAASLRMLQPVNGHPRHRVRDAEAKMIVARRTRIGLPTQRERVPGGGFRRAVRL